jgi:hypothetical protein
VKVTFFASEIILGNFFAADVASGGQEEVLRPQADPEERPPIKAPLRE